MDDLITFAEGLARIASTGGGVKALAARLAAQIDGAVLVEDADWRHLALAGSGSRSVQASMRESIEAADANGPIVHLESAGRRPCLAVEIRAGENSLGWVSVFPNGAADDAATVGAIRLAAAALAVECAREADGGKGRRKAFWDRLLARSYDDATEARDDAASRGITLAAGYVAVAVEAEGLDEATAAAKNAELRRVALETLRSPSGEIVVHERGGASVFLCPAPLEVDAANVRTAAGLIPRALTKAHAGLKLVGGVGRHAEAIALARSVDEAREAMFIARRLFGGSRIMPHEDLGIYPLLLRGGGSTEELRRFGSGVLAPLKSYDEKHQTELIRTLRLYFEVGQNVKTAAAQLNVHRHTVFYRLRQIAEISGLDLDSAHDQLTLRTAMALDAIH